jgi:hypothetical protein
MVHLAHHPNQRQCPNCKSGDVDIVSEGGKHCLICLDCGFEEFVE